MSETEEERFMRLWKEPRAPEQEPDPLFTRLFLWALEERLKTDGASFQELAEALGRNKLALCDVPDELLRDLIRFRTRTNAIQRDAARAFLADPALPHAISAYRSERRNDDDPNQDVGGDQLRREDEQRLPQAVHGPGRNDGQERSERSGLGDQGHEADVPALPPGAPADVRPAFDPFRLVVVQPSDRALAYEALGLLNGVTHKSVVEDWVKTGEDMPFAGDDGGDYAREEDAETYYAVAYSIAKARVAGEDQGAVRVLQKMSGVISDWLSRRPPASE